MIAALKAIKIDQKCFFCSAERLRRRVVLVERLHQVPRLRRQTRQKQLRRPLDRLPAQAFNGTPRSWANYQTLAGSFPSNSAFARIVNFVNR